MGFRIIGFEIQSSSIASYVTNDKFFFNFSSEIIKKK